MKSDSDNTGPFRRHAGAPAERRSIVGGGLIAVPRTDSAQEFSGIEDACSSPALPSAVAELSG